MTKFALINKKLTPIKEAKISINERGFLFGDGIFETCRVDHGRIYNFAAHIQRIKLGLEALKFDADIADLEKQCYRLITKNQIRHAILRISISRGIGSKGYAPTYDSKALIVIQTKNKTPLKKQKITLALASKPKPPSNALPIHCKTAQSLPYILNKMEAQEKGVFDCVMLTQQGYVSETSAANIFWVKDGQLFTPSSTCDVVLGTIRQKIIDHFEVTQINATIDALQKADEVFLTNVSHLVLNVNEFEKRQYDRNEIGTYVMKFLKKDITSTLQP